MKNKAAQQLGRLGGLVKSEAKTKASRENGKKGGRPKKEDDLPRCEACKTFLGDSTIAICKCGKYRW